MRVHRAAPRRARPLKGHEDELKDMAPFIAGAYRSVLQAYVPD
jgi:hypothetical protein